MKASYRVILKQYGIGFGVYAVLFVVLESSQRGLLPMIATYPVFAIALLVTVLIMLAPFGIGPFGRELTRAALQDERAEWRH
jgi:hypothetical protein